MLILFYKYNQIYIIFYLEKKYIKLYNYLKYKKRNNKYGKNRIIR